MPAPEALPEKFEQQSPEGSKPPQPKAAAQATEVALPTAPAAPPTQARSLSPLERRIEDVLADGLEDFYRSLNPREQEAFRRKGEETAVAISTLLGQFKVKLSEILNLIREWLQSIPGLNRYFVEQTAKIKADRVLKLK